MEHPLESNMKESSRDNPSYSSDQYPVLSEGEPTESAQTAEQPLQNEPKETECAVGEPSSGAVAKTLNESVAGPRELLNQQAQGLIDDINTKRKQDSQLLLDFKKDQYSHVNKSCAVVEQSLFDVYESQGKIIQDKLQELFATLDRVAQLETELQEFKTALSRLYQEMHLYSDPGVQNCAIDLN